MAVFEKNGSVAAKAPKEDHYNDDHGAWCVQLLARGVLKDDHIQCVARWNAVHNPTKTRKPNTEVGIARRRRIG